MAFPLISLCKKKYRKHEKPDEEHDDGRMDPQTSSVKMKRSVSFSTDGIYDILLVGRSSLNKDSRVSQAPKVTNKDLSVLSVMYRSSFLEAT